MLCLFLFYFKLLIYTSIFILQKKNIYKKIKQYKNMLTVISVAFLVQYIS